MMTRSILAHLVYTIISISKLIVFQDYMEIDLLNKRLRHSKENVLLDTLYGLLTFQVI